MLQRQPRALWSLTTERKPVWSKRVQFITQTQQAYKNDCLKCVLTTSLITIT